MISQKRTYKLLDHQKKAISELRTGSILLGSVGSGKSLAALAYFYKICGGSLGDEYLEPTGLEVPKDLYIITTANKRDTLDWSRDAAIFSIYTNRSQSIQNIQLTVDSWNNIKKYIKIENAFFIFDEQKVVGSGTWARSFIKIAKQNDWILLTATPGDVWLDYVSVFVANGFYKNKTDFIRKHVVYNPFLNFPKVQKYLNEEKLLKLKKSIIVKMDFKRKRVTHNIDVILSFDKELENVVVKKKWNPFENRPIKNASEGCYLMRLVPNLDPNRLKFIKKLMKKHKRLIIFYNFDPELEILRQLDDDAENYSYAEYNGHLHQDIPKSEKWVYVVQYISASEAWNCTETNAIVFYSQNYSYKTMTQAAGRIDRMNTPYLNLYYYHLRSKSEIDLSILNSLKKKTKFNERKFLRDKKISF